MTSFHTALVVGNLVSKTDPFKRWHLQKLVDIFYQTGLSWRWCWDGRLTDDTSALKGPLILPEAHCLTAEQIAACESR